MALPPTPNHQPKPPVLSLLNDVTREICASELFSLQCIESGTVEPSFISLRTQELNGQLVERLGKERFEHVRELIFSLMVAESMLNPLIKDVDTLR